LIFSESYDSKWVASVIGSKLEVASTKYHGRLNSFVLPIDGSYSLKIYYTPQDYVNIGVIISLVSLFFTLGTLTFLIIKKL